ncbi:DUF418 domain-containing protein [Stappia sp.]|uniref:DUF418 domain-containing protein n=1 Tax=Stappia sp. TaxID=1870903 RepID=UPI0032D97FCE
MLDALRGFAALGILWRNIFVFGMPSVAFSLPVEWGTAVGANVATWLFVAGFVDGTMRGLFSLLFGASALLLLDKYALRPDGLAAADLYFRRLAGLIALGVIHGYLLLWPNDILFVYGVVGMFLFLLRSVSARGLLVLALVLLSVSTLKDGLGWGLEGDPFDAVGIAGGDVPDPAFDLGEEEAAQGAVAEQASGGGAPADGAVSEEEAFYADVELQAMAEIDERLQSYSGLLATIAPLTFEEQTRRLVADHLLDVGAMMVLGMALYRLGGLSGRWSWRVYAAMAVVGLSVGGTLGMIVNAPSVLVAWSPYDPGEAIGYFYNPRRVSLCLGLVGAFHLLARIRAARWLLAPLQAAGRVALTIYVSQSVLCALLFYGPGLGLFGEFEHVTVLQIAFGLNALQLLLAWAWVRSGRQGPLEALIRRVAGDTRPAA